MKQFSKTTARRLAPVALMLAFATVSYAAGNSPVGQWLQNARTEATSVWAVCGAVIGLVVGLIGMLFGEHHAKEWAAKVAILSVCLLSVEALVAWL